ncbi:MAG TPA: hypothetical protein VJ973_09320, partial [Christiangramia sp.]|nr:hypothetical protein [Christiangramia sp.]
VGKEVLNYLIQDHRYDKILVFSRKVIPIEHPKLEIVLDSLTDLKSLSDKIIGDELYCCLGTTRRKAGSKEAFKKVDLDMPGKLAQMASSNEVDGFIVISSIGAGKSGRGFYLDVKTSMEEEVSQYPIKRLAIVRPSLLLASREEYRFSEETGKFLDFLTGWVMKGSLRKYKGIKTSTVARAMIEIMNLDTPKVTWESDELQRF